MTQTVLSSCVGTSASAGGLKRGCGAATYDSLFRVLIIINYVCVARGPRGRGARSRTRYGFRKIKYTYREVGIFRVSSRFVSFVGGIPHTPPRTSLISPHLPSLSSLARGGSHTRQTTSPPSFCAGRYRVRPSPHAPPAPQKITISLHQSRRSSASSFMCFLLATSSFGVSLPDLAIA